jgi:hypothetical protein
MSQPEVNIRGVVMQLYLVFVLRWGAEFADVPCWLHILCVGDQKRCVSALHMLHLLHDPSQRQL